MIEQGLLWFDDHPTRPIGVKIARAVQHYQQKYGQNPDVCYVHPVHLAPEGHTEGVKVLPAKSVLPNHFWLGMQVKP